MKPGLGGLTLACHRGLAAARQLVMPTTPDSVSVPPPSPMPVALCEPDPLLCALLGEWLQRAHYLPLSDAAASCASARVVLVVADLPAPRLDGAARIAILRQRFPGAKVLAISGQFMGWLNGCTATASALGADAILAKPFTSALFIDAVRMIVPA
jgi:CheY-like chemotaxis protein